MIIVHDIFICKPGNASKLAKMFKEAMADNAELVNVMTDMTGQFNKVVMVTKYDNLTAYEQSWESYMKNEEAMKKMKDTMAGYQEMYLTGSRGNIPGLVIAFDDINDRIRHEADIILHENGLLNISRTNGLPQGLYWGVTRTFLRYDIEHLYQQKKDHYLAMKSK